MHIAQIVSTYPPYRGGTGMVAHQLAVRIPHLITLTPRHAIKDDHRQERVHYLSPLLSVGNAAALPQLFTILRRFDRVLLHYPFIGGAEWALFSRLIRRRQRLIVYYHNDLVAPADLLRRVVFWWYRTIILPALVRVADHIVVSSIDYARHSDLKSYFTTHEQKFVAAPPAADTDLFRPLHGDAACIEISSRLKRLAKPVYAFVGGLDRAHSFKGVEVVLRAVSEAKQRGTPVSLAIAGDGDERSRYAMMAKQLGITDQVAFLGSVSGPELNCLYNHAYATVLPSVNRGEAFGIVLIESLAAGTPVIASDLPGVRTVTEEGRCGITVTPGDYQKLADTLIAFSAHPDRRLALALNARACARQYSWDTMTHIIQRLCA